MIELNKIYLEDCIEGMKKIPEGSVDMICVDPPFGSTDCEWDIRIPIDEMFKGFLRVCKENAAIVIFSQLPFSVDLINAQRKLYRYEWIWAKNIACGFLNAKKMPLRAHENILVFYRRLPTYNPQFWEGEKVKKKKKPTRTSSVYHKHGADKAYYSSPDGSRYPLDVLHVKTAGTEQTEHGYFKPHLHPTQKPLPLVEYLIKTYTNEGETVLDTCMGSGTTAIAAINTNRNFIGFETEQKFVDIANQRIEEVKSENLLLAS